MNYFSLSYFVAGRSKTIVWKIYIYIYISIFIITVYKTSLNFHWSTMEQSQHVAPSLTAGFEVPLLPGQSCVESPVQNLQVPA